MAVFNSTNLTIAASPSDSDAALARKPALLKLEQSGWISAAWGASESGREVKIYALTKAGRKQLKAAEASWQNASDVVGRFFKIQEGQ